MTAGVQMLLAIVVLEIWELQRFVDIGGDRHVRGLTGSEKKQHVSHVRGG